MYQWAMERVICSSQESCRRSRHIPVFSHCLFGATSHEGAPGCAEADAGKSCTKSFTKWQMLTQELELAPPAQKQSAFERSDSRAVLVPAGAQRSEGSANPTSHLPYTSVKLQTTAEGAQPPHPPRPPHAWRWHWDPLRNWRGWSWREFFFLAGPALLMAVAYLVCNSRF